MIESLVAGLGQWLPFGYAFAAGMVTTVSPCGIAMLPAYVSLHLDTRAEDYRRRSALRRAGRALLMSGVVTAGFAIFFGAMGVVLSAGGQYLGSVIPWLAVFIGVVLIVLGIYVLAGGHLYLSLPARLAGRVGGGGAVGVRGFLVFGIAYGIASLSCTLPVFLAVVGSAIAEGGFGRGLLQYLSYSLGMGFVIVIVTLATALLQEGVMRWIRRLVPLVARLSGLLLIFAGAYIIYFWLAVGRLAG